MERQGKVHAVEGFLRVEVGRARNHPPVASVGMHVPNVVPVAEDTMSGDFLKMRHLIVRALTGHLLRDAALFVFRDFHLPLPFCK